MSTRTMVNKIAVKVAVLLLSVAMLFTMMPMLGNGFAYADDQSLKIETPVLVVSGQGLIGNGGEYSADNVSKEKSYTLDELKSLTEAQGRVIKQKFSAKKSQSPYAKNYYLVDGVKISSLLGKEESEITDDVKVIATDNYETQFLQNKAYENNGMATTVGLNNARYFYDFSTGEKGEQVPAVIGWADINTELTDGSAPEALPSGDTSDLKFLRLYCGQYDGEGGGVEDMNQPLWNGKDANTYVNMIQEGDAIAEVILTVGSKDYTRKDLLLMDFAERSYTYNTSSGEVTDTVRGVPFSALLEGEDDDSEVSFAAADGYDMSSATKTVKQLVDGNYMLGYAIKDTQNNDWKGIYKTAKSDASKYGFLSLYGDGTKPASMINKVTVISGSGIDYSKSPYKHITNGGIDGQDGPYKIDAITGATLTIEGPGMKTSTPLSVKDLESQNSGCARGVYSDTRNGSKVTRTYEGVDLYYILNSMKKSSIEMTDRAYKVTVKNRNRQSIATLDLETVKEMHDEGEPALVSYGTANEDGTNPRPYVFDGATGEDTELGNGDGCLKFVYNLDKYGNQGGKYTKFSNMAYIYVEEKEAPGFKHVNPPYNTAENSQYVLTVTGDEIGREINYTVEELENLVEYDIDGNVIDNGYGWRDEYSLANSSYWYVNSYEGVKLWSLLQRSGIDKSKSNDDETIVSFSATDGYNVFDTFSLKQVADPNQFGFYEKNAADNNDGTYKPNENIRQGSDVTTGDKLRVGYPVLVSYGANYYPYVISKDLDGYLSGLSNDGGPLRVISGKWDYNHANGSNQAKLLDKIIVGGSNYIFSTHTYNKADSAYKALEDNKLVVNINASGKIITKEYTIKDIEKLIYSGELTKTQLGEAKIKSFYETSKNGNFYSDLYEGINLNYFLRQVVELPGEQGTISFNGEEPMKLEEVLGISNGYNATTKLGGLSPVIAYAKNGYPLVVDKNADGYVKNQVLKGVAEGEEDSEYTVQNNGGPLELVFPRANKDASDTLGKVENITTIDINLEADKYAHIGDTYATLAAKTLIVSGEGTRIDGEKTFTVEELEGKQTLATTRDYSFRNSSGTVSEQRYRGLNLYNFLKSTNVGLKSNAYHVYVYGEGMTEPVEFALNDIKKNYSNSKTGENDLPVMLAYGSAAAGATDVKDGKPLVTSSTDNGYVAAYGNDGGPLKLVIGEANSTDTNKSKCVKNVTKIEIDASEQTSWNHNSSEVFKQYLNDTIEINAVDNENNQLKSKIYKVSEIEDMTDLVSQEEIYATSTNVWEGVNFWQLIKRALADVEGINDPITITVTAKDGFSVDAVEKVGMDGLKDGVKDGENYVPVMLCYAVDGYPLVYGGKGAGSQTGEGYDSTADNKGGPLRLMVHMAQGACLMEVVKVTVKVGQAAPPAETVDFKVGGVENGNLTVADLKALNKETEKEYTVKGTTEKVRGVLLKDVLESFDLTDNSIKFSIDAGGYKGEGTYENLTIGDAAAEDYLVAYDEYVDGDWKAIDDTSKTPQSKVRIYRNYLENHPDADQTKWFNKCQYISGIVVTVPEYTKFDVYEGTSQEGDLPLSGVRSTVMDRDGNLWVSTYGGGIACKEFGSDKFTVYNKTTDPALLGATISSLCPDDNGGVWFTQNQSHKDVSTCCGVGYLKDGEVKYYRAIDNPKTIPSDYCSEIKIDSEGNVWFGCIGGLTKYDPILDKWTTISEGLPASVIKNDIPLEQTGYVENIEFDDNGGIWVGFYPDCEGGNDGEHPYVGGIAYIKNDKVVHSYQLTSEKEGDWYRLQDVWIRDIAIDSNGGIWCIASSIYGNMENIGGKVYYISSTDAEPVEYSGFDLFGEDAFSTNSELRMVTVDPDGGLWFGTSKDGLFYVEDPTITDNKLTLKEKYSSSTKSWNGTGYDNIYSLDFIGNTIYAGSSAGLATHAFEFEHESTSPGPAGDTTKDKADLIITGNALARNGYFSIKGIKNDENIKKLENVKFTTLNKDGNKAEVIVSGATLENIFTDVVGMAKGRDIGTVEIISNDGRTTEYSASDVLDNDIQGNKAMFIWTEAGDKVTKTAIGQFSEDQINKSRWAKNVVKIVVNVPSGPVAEIGDNKYNTLQEAVNAAGSGATIKLLRKASGDGIYVPEGNKTLTFDFNGNEYVSKTAASAAPEEKQSFMNAVLNALQNSSKEKAAFYIGAGNTVTIKNGKISSNSEELETLIYNDNATIEINNTMIKGNNLAENGVAVVANGGKTKLSGSTGIETAKGATALSVSGDEETEVGIDTKGIISGSIQLESGKATIKNVNLTGDISKEEGANLEITGGSFESEIDKEWLKPDSDCVIIKAMDGSFKVFTIADALTFQADEINSLLKKLDTQQSELERQSEELKQLKDQAAKLEEQIKEIENLKLTLSTQLDTINEQQKLIEELQAKQAETEAILNLSLMKLNATAKATDYSTVVVSWSCDEEPDGYLVDGVDVGTSLNKKFTGLKTGKASAHTVSAYLSVNGKKITGTAIKVSATPKLSATKFTYGKSKKRAVTLKWNKVSGASGYVLYRSTKKTKGFKAIKTIKKQSTVKYKTKKMKKGKKYYFKVRAYRLVDGKRVYSSYSTAKYIKIK